MTADPANHKSPISGSVLGAAVRRALKAMGLPWKVKCETIAVAGHGFGSETFANICADRELTYIECSKLADVLRGLRSRGIVRLQVSEIDIFPSEIHAKDYPSGSEFWRQLRIDLVLTPEKKRRVTPVIREAQRRVLLAYRAEKQNHPNPSTLRQDDWCKAWIEEGMSNAASWGANWPESRNLEEMPAGWPGIMHFEGQEIVPLGKIICFAVPRQNPVLPGDVDAVAVDRWGTFITAQVCSGPGWARHDLGVNGGDHHLRFHGWFYNQLFPRGYELEWVETPTENWDGQREHTDDTVEPWHLDPANESTWRRPAKEVAL